MASLETHRGKATETFLPGPMNDDEMAVGKILSAIGLMRDPADRYNPRRAIRAVEGQR